MSNVRSKRRTFTVHEKRHFVNEMDGCGLSIRAYSEKVNINETVLRRWKKLMPIFDQNVKRSRKIRNKPRDKCSMHPEIDIRVMEWVRYRNQKGIRVKDSFIQARAQAVREELLAEMPASREKQNLARFQASRMWVHRYAYQYDVSG